MTLVTDDLLRLAPVIPVVVVDDPEDAVPLARALAAGGLPAVEITLRTTSAIEAIRLVAAEVPEAVVGAGTVVTPPQVDDVLDAGAHFLVTPGTTPTLLDALLESGRPFLPGAATASEVVALLERGVTAAKLFPAAPLGGPALLRAFAGPFPQVRFCPTGGIGQATAPEYLGLPNVACVGGSWMLPSAALAARDWGRIEDLARTAAQLGPVVPA